MAQFSGFVRESKFTPKSLGNENNPPAEKFYFTVKTLTNTDNFELSAVMLAVQRDKQELEKITDETDKATRGELAQKIARAVIEGFKPIAEKYCVLHNLNDGENNPLAISDICDYPIFQETVIELMNFLIDLSTPGEDDTKN